MLFGFGRGRDDLHPLALRSSAPHDLKISRRAKSPSAVNVKSQDIGDTGMKLKKNPLSMRGCYHPGGKGAGD